MLTDLSQNGVILRKERVVPHRPYELRDGDTIQLGAFVISVALTPEIDNISQSLPSGTTIIDGHSPPPDLVPNDVSEQISAGRIAAPKSRAKKTRPATAGSAYGSEFVAQFASAAGIDPDQLAGRTDAEFARELGALARISIDALGKLFQSTRDSRAAIGFITPRNDEGSELPDDNDDLLLHLLQSRQAPALVNEICAELIEHDRALLPALQFALFKLLNEIAPTSIEARIGAGIIRPHKARCWNEYARLWEEYSATGHNGVYDVLLSHLAEEYEANLRKS